MRVVIALGGNAMTAIDGSANPIDQQNAIERASGPIADLAAAGHQLLITHGNGPQVGNLLVKNELAAAVVPPVPLDWCGAQTQATIGALLLNALDRALTDRRVAMTTAVLVSRTLVDENDPGFSNPSKPIGRYLPAAEAQLMIGHGQRWQDRGDRGWRRVVASPEPLACLDSPAAVTLLQAGYLVVCSGGGGIPVCRTGPGSYRGVEAVIDKDLTAQLLAREVRADLLVIATDVEQAVLGWQSTDQRPIGEVFLDDLEGFAVAGEFAGGSMGPKVDAVCRFVRHSGHPAVITSLAGIGAAVAGKAGTRVSAHALPTANLPTANLPTADRPTADRPAVNRPDAHAVDSRAVDPPQHDQPNRNRE